MIERQFQKWINSTDTVILACWDLGHIWEFDLYDSIEKRPHGAHMLIGSCQRGCGVVRARYLTSSWSPDSSKNSYKYPRGYSPKDFMEGNPFFMSAEHRAAIRRELARRSQEGKKKFRSTTVRTSRGETNVIEAKFSG